MTKEELLIPRYKVIADYPGNGLDVGTIMNPSPDWKEFTIVFWCKANDKFPHLFQRLPWWSDRKVEDMPYYLKQSGYVDSKNRPVPDMCIKVLTHFKSGSGDWRNDSYNGFIPEADPKGTLPYSLFEPVTEEEYTAYINQSK